MSKQINSWDNSTDAPKVSSANEVTRIPAGSEIRHGALISSDDIRIDGRFFGKVITKSRVIIGEKAIFKGEIVAENADVYGMFEGDIYVGEVLSLMNECNVDGGIHIQKLVVENGAKFDGNCQIITKDEFNKMANDFQDKMNKEYPSMSSSDEKKANKVKVDFSSTSESDSKAI